jgi:hypothetical protein
LTVTNGNIAVMNDADNPDRDQYLHVKLTSDEKTRLRVKAAQLDMSMSEYVRHVVFGEDPKAVPA